MCLFTQASPPIRHSWPTTHHAPTPAPPGARAPARLHTPRAHLKRNDLNSFWARGDARDERTRDAHDAVQHRDLSRSALIDTELRAGRRGRRRRRRWRVRRRFRFRSTAVLILLVLVVDPDATVRFHGHAHLLVHPRPSFGLVDVDVHRREPDAEMVASPPNQELGRVACGRAHERDAVILAGERAAETAGEVVHQLTHRRHRSGRHLARPPTHSAGEATVARGGAVVATTASPTTTAVRAVPARTATARI